MGLNTDITILLVEDAAVMRKMERKVLGTLGFENIVEAENGRDAILKLGGGQHADLIISDWNMPEMNGYDLLVWVRAQDEYKELPFLMATGRGEKKEVSQATAAGVSSFISKPFNAEELRKKIEEAFGMQQEEEAVDTGPKVTESGKVKMKIAHIQITDHLALGVLKHLIEKGELKPKHFELETECMSSWNPVADNLEKGSIDGAFILAPLAMDLFNYGAPIKLVMFAHKNGSIFVRNKKGKAEGDQASFFKERSFYIPHTMSIHNMLAHMFFKGVGLQPGVTGDSGVDVNFEVIAPIKMPEFLSGNEDAGGYLVAEPLGTKAIATGIAELQFLSSELWKNHPCCVVTLRKEFVEEYEEAVYEFTAMLSEAGKYITQKPALAAEIAVNFLDPNKQLGLKVPILKNVLTDPKGITFNDLYPVKEDLDQIQQYMSGTMGIGSLIDLDEFVDLRFADQACKETAGRREKSELHASAEAAVKILKRGFRTDKESSEKALLNKEGQYLMFNLDAMTFGVDILRIIEISRHVSIRDIPQSSEYILGVINFRGKVIPVIDPRTLFGLPKGEYDKDSFIIILEIETLGQPLLVGLAVDSVSEISMIRASNIEDAPGFLRNVHTKYILAMARLEEEIRILVDIDRLFDSDMSKGLQKLYKAG